VAKYNVNLIAAVNLSVTVEADNEDAALEAAMDQAPGLCGHCTGWGQKTWCLELGEYETLEEFFGDRYKPDLYGKTVELAEEH
jgi:hypothetical protein